MVLTDILSYISLEMNQKCLYEDSLSGIEFSDPDVNNEEASIKKRSRGEDCIV